MPSALDKSIQKWHDVVHNSGLDKGSFNCTLCQETSESVRCDGCLVYEETKRHGCLGTPHEEWVAHQRTDHACHSYYSVRCAHCLVLATNELLFLKSLKENDDVDKQGGAHRAEGGEQSSEDAAENQR